ncbi:uncharacterized protein IUM83_00485 [Phytophthora cinnamomi]|uniref:uncharacterized protein n=1 Tax=Phytophthora cinnamomi TaxID=4785 RepID=UPI00355A0EA9|nr:hypothetical protein IUM83_00485 [Phytophthora cinnamomi]
MPVRLPGWSDAHVSTLLALFRKHLLLYVYSSDSHFAEVVRAELPDKTASDVQEMVRSLMTQFGLMLTTKNFRTNVIMTNGQEVYVYEHIYESISQLAENRAGGLWLPDELSRFLQKAKQYRELFSQSQDVYFTRIQLWGKSVAETKSKFYALRDIYIKEKRRSRQRQGVGARRFELLKEIFADVQPRRTEKVDLPSKAPKLWSSEDMEKLVDFLVRITDEIQRTGSSDLVKHVAETLHRTEGSCVNKLADMRDKFRKRSTSVRAANLPNTVFEPTSEAYKIFHADWNDSNDPYALGYQAIKSRCSRLTAERNKRRRRSIWSPRPKLRSATLAARGAPSANGNQTNPSVRNDGSVAPVAPDARVQHEACASHLNDPSINERVTQSAPTEGTTAKTLAANDYAAFVRDIAEQCEWTEMVVDNVLRCMQHSIDLYRSNRLVAFFDKIASLTPGVTFQDLFADAQHILTQFEQRFGTLDGFENIVLATPDVNSCVKTSEQETQEQNHLPNSAGDVVPTIAGVSSGEVTENIRNLDYPGEAAGGIIDQSEHYREPDGSPAFGSPAQAPQMHNEDAIIDVYEHGQSSPPGSPAQTPQTRNEDVIVIDPPPLGGPAQTPHTGNEDGADEHSTSTTGKQSSPEGTWDDGADANADADLDDDGLDDNQSVGSSDNAWLGSSNNSDTKKTCHTKDDLSYPISRHFVSESSKKPSKRGKDDQYGKNFDLAKKRRLDEKSTVKKSDDDDEEEEVDVEDEGYDEGDDDDDYQSEEADEEQLADDDSVSSNGEQEKIPHPLQSIIDSLESHIAGLQEKQRKLIQRKEEREWRQRQYVDHEYGIHLSMHAFSSER